MIMCGDCGRELLPRDAVASGFIARCGRRLKNIADCKVGLCETRGMVQFDVDGAVVGGLLDDIIVPDQPEIDI